MNIDWTSLLPFLTALQRQPDAPSPDGDSDPPEDESDGGGAVLSPSQKNGGAAAFSQSNLIGNTAPSLAQGADPQAGANKGQELTQPLQSGQSGYNQGLKERVYAPEGTRGHELMDNPLVQGEAYNLFKDSMYGNDRREHSMWVISNDGQYSTVRWPWSAQTDKEEWKGDPPDGAVAIVHTHPTATSEQPSSSGPKNDQDLAMGKQSSKIRMPVYVLHRNGVWKVDPGTGKNIHVRDYRWMDEFKDGGDSK